MFEAAKHFIHDALQLLAYVLTVAASIVFAVLIVIAVLVAMLADDVFNGLLALDDDEHY